MIKLIDITFEAIINYVIIVLSWACSLSPVTKRERSLWPIGVSVTVLCIYGKDELVGKPVDLFIGYFTCGIVCGFRRKGGENNYQS
jgi:hypothetical protein